ncbi:MAG: YggS family pyridoxal phosphate-dependent enzyme [Nanoarchaeota archaeon]|nr:YggS family pyridoxal phosphate-dependent enzyme [Nanoarchaeota archaeon]
MEIKENIGNIRKDIPSDVILVAATKTRSIDEVNETIDAGIKVIGENYIQEAEEKFDELKGKVKFHFIGHLQTNKVKRAVEIFDMIETVDSLKIAKEIDKRCGDIGKVMPILIEVNSGKEPNKDGVMPEGVVELVKGVSLLENIRIKGLMTMAPYFDNPEKDRPYFKEMNKLFEKLREINVSNVEMNILSMGMSDSYKIAIEEGSNMVRVGTKIFGVR